MSILRSLDEIVGAVSFVAEAAAGAVAGAAADVSADAATGRPRILIGIAGSPGSGKSTVAAALLDRLSAASGAPRAAALLPMDGFHFPQARLVALGRRERMGAPDTFDVDAFVAVLRAIRAEQGPVAVPGFDRRIEEPVPGAGTIDRDARLIVIEGNYLLHPAGGWEQVAPLLDLSLFIDLDPGIRHDRLIARHERFGKTPAAAHAWALGPDERNAVLIEATASRADHRVQLHDEATSR